MPLPCHILNNQEEGTRLVSTTPADTNNINTNANNIINNNTNNNINNNVDTNTDTNNNIDKTTDGTPYEELSALLFPWDIMLIISCLFRGVGIL